MDSFGSAENIAFWCNWTPQQMSLLSSDCLLHVLLTSAPSTGKTTLLVAKAIELAQKKEHVLFLIYASRFFNCHRLLELQLAVKFAGLEAYIVIEPIAPFVQEETESTFG